MKSKPNQSPADDSAFTAAPCSVWLFEFCRKSDCKTSKVRYRAFDEQDAYAQFESDVDPDDVSWVSHSLAESSECEKCEGCGNLRNNTWSDGVGTFGIIACDKCQGSGTVLMQNSRAES